MYIQFKDRVPDHFVITSSAMLFRPFLSNETEELNIEAFQG